MKLLQFLPVQLTVFIILGIFTGFYFPFSTQLITFLLLIGFAVLFYFYYKSNYSYNKNIFFSATALCLSFIIGFANINFVNGKNNPKNYSHFLKQTNKIQLQIIKILKPSSNNYKYIARVKKINNHNSSGKILLSVVKDSVVKPLIIDDNLYTFQKIKSIQKPLNPYLFDYNDYLKKKNIHNQIIIKNSYEILKLKNTKPSFAKLAYLLRNKINKKLSIYNIKPNEKAIINALLLGKRQNISKNLLSNYTNAGVIHILAISGLHIGILLFLLNFLFKPVERLKNGKILKLILIILLLWTYAFITGLSASVVRAVTMFTAVAIGLSLRKSINIYNVLFTSMFILLLFNPYYVFDIGFQLSYSAVFAIIWIQPLLYNLWKPKFIVDSYFWKLITLSIAAQLGVLPLTLYYFHQFPILFLVSNIVIIPFLGFILGAGILIIIVLLFANIPNFLIAYYVEIIHWLNIFISWIAIKKHFLITQISFSFAMMLCSYFIIISLVSLWSSKEKKLLFYVLSSIIIFQSIMFFDKYKQMHSSFFVVFQQYKKTLLAVQRNSFLSVKTNSLTKYGLTIIDAYKLKNAIYKSAVNTSLKNIYALGTNYLLIVDSLDVYKVKNLKKPYILLRQNPKINLERLIAKLHPKQIIADGSNYKTYVNRWNKTCVKLEIPFYNTSVNGAWILPLTQKMY